MTFAKPRALGAECAVYRQRSIAGFFPPPPPPPRRGRPPNSAETRGRPRKGGTTILTQAAPVLPRLVTRPGTAEFASPRPLRIRIPVPPFSDSDSEEEVQAAPVVTPAVEAKQAAAPTAAKPLPRRVFLDKRTN